MFQQFYAGLMFALGLLSPRHDARLQFLLLQIKILKARLRSDRVVPTPEERAELLRLGASLQDDISDIIAIVKPETYRKWRVQSRDGKVAKRSGPAGLAIAVKELICRLAKENVMWGYRRIVGELKKQCLTFFMCFSLDQLHYIVKTWCTHYNTVRPHRGHGMNNNVLDEQFKPEREGPVRCREKLGGLIKEYYREAA